MGFTGLSLRRIRRLDYSALRRRLSLAATRVVGVRHVPALVTTVALWRTGTRARVAYDKGARAYRHRFGELVMFDTRPRAISPDFWERRVHEVFASHVDVRDGDVVVDVGAGIGTETILLSRCVGARGEVFAVEAHPNTHRLLCMNVAQNCPGNVRALNFAAARATALVALTDLANHESNFALAVGERRRDGNVVPSAALDSLLPAVGKRRVRLLKMNIEGAETEALLGARSLLARTDAVSVSCHDFKATQSRDLSLRTSHAVTDLLTDAGFIVRPVTTDGPGWLRFTLHGLRSD